ncbi:MAG: GIY-YIG nuclease family protein [Patescibacteria group bacterium]|jgi:putative endonuclease|nr:GIY-YIG nuclease family protein [Patescibacteria group bacterium]
MFYVYILQSTLSQRLYVGKTTNLKVRITEHNAGQNASTKPYRPWEIIFYEAYVKKSDADRREKYLKTTQGHQAIHRMLRDYLSDYNYKHFEYQGSTT